MTELKDRQKRFVAEYLVDLNATKAAIRAGYSKNSASEIGYENLRKPHIAEAIEKAQEKRNKRVEISQDDVVNGLARIAFNDMREMFDEHGNLMPIQDLPESVALSLAGLDVVTVKKGEGEVEYVSKIRSNDRLKAFELLGRHMKMFTDKVENSITKYSDVSDEELDERIKSRLAQS